MGLLSNMIENENIGESSHSISEYSISRAGWGDFVLLGWNANQKTKTRPTCGTQLLAFNPRGAARIWQKLLGTRPGPWDNVLFDLLADVEDSAFLGMSYVYPAIGGFGVHISTATPTQNSPDVSCRWSASHLCEGAGAPPKDGKKGHTARWICGLNRRGPARHWKKVDYTKKTWLTMRPPDYFSSLSHRLDMKEMKDFCERREWIKNDVWCGPQPHLFARRLKGGGKGKGKQMSEEPSAKGSDGGNVAVKMPEAMEVLCARPWERVDKHGKKTEISRLAAELVVDTISYPWYEAVTERVLKKRRSNVSKYKRRVFTDDEAMLIHIGRCLW